MSYLQHSFLSKLHFVGSTRRIRRCDKKSRSNYVKGERRCDLPDMKPVTAEEPEDDSLLPLTERVGRERRRPETAANVCGQNPTEATERPRGTTIGRSKS